MIKNVPVIFYDAECGFCNYWIQWILKTDSKGAFFFAPLQSVSAQKLLSLYNFHQKLNTVYLYTTDKKILTKSKAVKYILLHINKLPLLLVLLKVLPYFVSNLGYDIVASIRRIIPFKSCRVLNENERLRFLTDSDIEKILHEEL